MRIHYYYRREDDKGFYNLELVAWLEEKEVSRQGYERLSFTRLERLRIFLSKGNNFHCHTIEHDFGEQSYYGHYAHTRKELAGAMKKDHYFLLTTGIMKGSGKWHSAFTINRL